MSFGFPPAESKPARLDPPAADVSVDPVRLADRSWRCLVLGLIGAVPMFGLPATLEAARVFHATAQETGESWKHAPFILRFVTGWTILAVSFVVAGLALALLVFLCGLAVLGNSFVARYRHTNAPTWNPARRWLYSGLALVYGQVFAWGSVAVGLLCVWIQAKAKGG